MPEVSLDGRGRLTLPKAMRERFGERYQVVQLDGCVKLIPIADDPLEGLRSEFASVEKSAEELRREARSAIRDGRQYR